MKKLGKDDLYQHVNQFLKEKGIEIQDAAPLGKGLQKGCQVLTETINSAQTTLEKASNRMDRGIGKMRDLIHKKTAPRKAKAPKSTQKRKKKAPAAKKTTKKATPKAATNLPKTRSKKSGKKAAKKAAAKKSSRKQ